MNRSRWFIGCWLLGVMALAGAKPYFPDPRAWQERQPAVMGFDEGRLIAAIDYAKANETRLPEQLA